MNLDSLKRAAAKAAALLVSDGMVVGLGTGSTATLVVEELGRRVREERLHFFGVPTSEETAAQARSLGIPLTTLAEHCTLDLAIDGADEIVEGPLHLTKGRGGALLREKLVEVAAKRLVIVADESKLVPQLGSRMPIPVEVVTFGWQSTARRLEALGCEAHCREGFTTDQGNLILDCRFAPIADPWKLARELDSIVGVVEHGLFLGMATEAFIASDGGIRHMLRGA